MEFYENNFKPLKNTSAFKLTHPLFDRCTDQFRVGCYRKTKFGYILFCKNLQNDGTIAVFSNTKLKREIENVENLEVENLLVPLEPIVFSTPGLENSKYQEMIYRKLFFI